MPKVVTLDVPHPNADLISELERALEQAKKAEIVGAVIVKLHPEEMFACVKAGITSDLKICGALQFAMFDIINANRPGDE